MRRRHNGAIMNGRINAPGGRGGSEGEGRRVAGEGRVYEAYEVKNKRQKLRCLLSPEKEKYFLFIYEVITWGKI